MPLNKRSPKSRKRRALVVWPFKTQLAMSTLAADAVFKATLMGLSDDAYLISADIMWSVREQTAGEGPLVVGIASDNLSTTEIAEGLDAAPAFRSDVIQNERAKRPVREAGMFPGLSTEEVLNNGIAIRTPIRMNLGGGTDLACFARNRSAATLTGGAIVELAGKVYGNWN